MPNRETIKVWDPLVRLFHWSLVVTFFVAYFTEDELGVHVVTGYLVLGLVLARILWGFVGPRYARFKDFVYAPAVVLSDLWATLRLKWRQRYLGHSPAGGAMVILLLIMLLATTVTGLMSYGADKHRGPLAPVMGAQTSVLSLPVAWADEENGAGAEDGDKSESPFKEVHEALANITLALIGLHVLAVLLASVIHRENLIGAMITGRKPKEIPVHNGQAESGKHAGIGLPKHGE